MRSEQEILAMIESLRGDVAGLEAYSRVKDGRRDRHGVVDAQMDLRDLEAAIAALEWAVGDGPLSL